MKLKLLTQCFVAKLYTLVKCFFSQLFSVEHDLFLNIYEFLHLFSQCITLKRFRVRVEFILNKNAEMIVALELKKLVTSMCIMSVIICKICYIQNCYSFVLLHIFKYK